MIKIFPINHYNGESFFKEKEPMPSDFLWKDNSYLFFYNGKTAIHYIMNKYKLSRKDEVCIFTSTNQNYVSTCVSGTIFNYSKISRVETEYSKLFYIIHEFGIPHPLTEEIVAKARKLQIPVVEDCAHTMDSMLNGKRVGTFGDYAIYSLPKHLPVRYGGLLVGKNLDSRSEVYCENVALEVKEDFEKFIDYLPILSKRRKENFNQLKEIVDGLPLEFDIQDHQTTPYFLIFRTPDYNSISRCLEKTVELGRTYVKNWICIPTQPLLSIEEITLLKDELRNCIRQS